MINHEIEFNGNYCLERDSNPHWSFINAQESRRNASLQFWISIYYTSIVYYSHYQRNQWENIVSIDMYNEGKDNGN